MADKNPAIGEMFKFLRDKEDRPIPLKAMFTFTPEEIKWDELSYDVNDLDLIKDTDNIKNIVWDKVPQSDFNVLRWVIQNDPDKIDRDMIDYNAKGVVGLLAKTNPELVDWSKFKIDSYVKAMQAVRSGKDEVDWSNQLDYNDIPTMKFMAKNAPELVDKSKIENEEIISIFSK